MGEKRKSEGRGTNRRGFLKGLLLGGAGAALVAASRESPASGDAPAPADTAPKGSAGYHETAHIRNYYKTAEL